MLLDEQTAGGLLIICPENQSKKLVNSLNENANFKSQIIGYMSKFKNKNIFIE